MNRSDSNGKEIENPLTRFGAWFVLAFFGSMAVAAFLPGQFRLAALALFLCGLFLTVWTFFEFRRGSISIPSGILGGVQTYKRGTEAVSFYLLVVLCLGFGVFFSVVMGYLLLFGPGG